MVLCFALCRHWTIRCICVVYFKNLLTGQRLMTLDCTYIIPFSHVTFLQHLIVMRWATASYLLLLLPLISSPSCSFIQGMCNLIESMQSSCWQQPTPAEDLSHLLGGCS